MLEWDLGIGISRPFFPPPESSHQLINLFVLTSDIDTNQLQPVHESSALPSDVSAIEIHDSAGQSEIGFSPIGHRPEFHSYHSDGERLMPEMDPEEPTLLESTYEELTEPEYKIHQEGSNKNCNNLSDGIGFVYSKKGDYKSSFTWRCTSRPKSNPCRALVKQKKFTNKTFLNDYEQSDFTFTFHIARKRPTATTIWPKKESTKRST